MICEVEDSLHNYDSNWANLSEKVAASRSRAKEQFRQINTRARDHQHPRVVEKAPTPKIHLENIRNEKPGAEDDEWRMILGDSGPNCLRCGKTVYLKELVEPHKGTTFHEWCFKCKNCSRKLNLSTFATSPKDPTDGQVYCKAHVPQLDVPRVDNTAKTISDCTQAPRLTTVNNQIRGADAGKAGKFDAGALCIQSALNVPRACDRRAHTPPPPNVIKSELVGLRYL